MMDFNQQMSRWYTHAWALCGAPFLQPLGYSIGRHSLLESIQIFHDSCLINVNPLKVHISRSCFSSTQATTQQNSTFCSNFFSGVRQIYEAEILKILKWKPLFSVYLSQSHRWWRCQALPSQPGPLHHFNAGDRPQVPLTSQKQALLVFGSIVRYHC